jgi:class 3 adenylate cyclase
VSETALFLLIAASAALVAVGLLWQRERRRAGRLESELASERAKRSGWGGLAPLPPLEAVLQTATRVRQEGLGEVLRSSFEELAGWAEDAEPELRALAARDGTLTILFSDIEDSTALNEQLGDKSWLKVLGAHDRIVRKCSGRHGGHVVKSQGDGFMIAFAGAEDAIRSAIEIQRALTSTPRRLRGTPVSVRIGLHTGPALQKGGDLFGRNVALAARVADEARGGEILVTPEVREAAAEADDLVFTDPREVELKGLPGSHTLVAVGWQDS